MVKLFIFYDIVSAFQYVLTTYIACMQVFYNNIIGSLIY